MTAQIKNTRVEKNNTDTIKEVMGRLQELSWLEDGWLNGEGTSLNEPGLKQFASSFEAYFDIKLPEPYLFPTPEGNLQAEWIINEVDITLSVNLLNQSALYQASSNKNEETDEAVLNLIQEQSWQQLNQKLTALSKS